MSLISILIIIAVTPIGLFAILQILFIHPFLNHIIKKIDLADGLAIQVEGKGYNLVTQKLTLDRLIITYKEERETPVILIDIDDFSCFINIRKLFKRTIRLSQVDIGFFFYRHILQPYRKKEEKIETTSHKDETQNPLIFEIHHLNVKKGVVEIQEWAFDRTRSHHIQDIVIKDAHFALTSPVDTLLFHSELSGLFLSHPPISFTIHRVIGENGTETELSIKHINAKYFIDRLSKLGNTILDFSDIDLNLRYHFRNTTDPFTIQGELIVNALQVGLPGKFGKTISRSFWDTLHLGSKIWDTMTSTFEEFRGINQVHSAQSFKVPFSIPIDPNQYHQEFTRSYELFFRDFFQGLRAQVLESNLRRREDFRLEIREAISQMENIIVLPWEIPIKIIDSVLAYIK